jgi:hypothetical protein
LFSKTAFLSVDFFSLVKKIGKPLKEWFGSYYKDGICCLQVPEELQHGEEPVQASAY